VSHVSQWIAVQLDPEEVALCRERGNQRQKHAEERGFKPYGYASSETHFRGYAAEMAFSKYLGVPMPEGWDWASDVRRGYDVAGWHVRSRKSSTGTLLIKPKDPEGNYVLVLTHQLPVLYIAGWTTAERGRRFGLNEYIGEARFKSVAQALLHPFPDIGGSFCRREERLAAV
jgi:hypothetical protein